jgi:hypothetical protein
MDAGTRSSALDADELISALAGTKGVKDIRRDGSWNYLLELAHHVGSTLKIGPLKAAFVSNETEDSNLALVPGKNTIAVVVDKYSLKEEVLERILLLTKNR